MNIFGYTHPTDGSYVTITANNTAVSVSTRASANAGVSTIAISFATLGEMSSKLSQYLTIRGITGSPDFINLLRTRLNIGANPVVPPTPPVVPPTPPVVPPTPPVVPPTGTPLENNVAIPASFFTKNRPRIPSRGDAPAWLNDVAFQREVFVSTRGNDDNDGLTRNTALRSIRTAIQRLDRRGGTKIRVIADGVYVENDGYGFDTALKAGAPNAWNAIVADDPNGPRAVLRGWRDWACLRVNADYWWIEGIEFDRSMVGATLYNLTFPTRAEFDAYMAVNHANSAHFATNNSDCLSIDGRAKQLGNTRNGLHHFVVRDVVAYGAPGGNITTVHCDYLLIEDCFTEGAANWSGYGKSNISSYQGNSIRLGGDANIFGIIIRRNVCMNALQRTASYHIGQPLPTDGNGIIIDDFNRNQDGTNLAYGRRVLVESNIAVNNGGTGVHAFSSKNVTIRNNTTYGNGRNKVQFPQFTASETQTWASHPTVIHDSNIFYALPPEINTVEGQPNGTFIKNITYSANGRTLAGTGTVVDPLFTDSDALNFTLAPNSPARNFPGADSGTVLDVYGRRWTLPGTPPIGAVW